MTNPNHPRATRPAGRRRRRAPARRGVIFIIALAIIVILTALLLVYAQEMRTESQAAANHCRPAQADAVETGAEQWVLAQVETYTTPLSGNTIDSNVGFGNTDVTTIPAAGLPVRRRGTSGCSAPTRPTTRRTASASSTRRPRST